MPPNIDWQKEIEETAKMVKRANELAEMFYPEDEYGEFTEGLRAAFKIGYYTRDREK